MNAGDTFQLAGAADRHLWIIISDPAIDPNQVLFVNLTTYDPREDQTVVLNVGDHPFIQHRTCVSYSRARVATNFQLEQLKNAQRLIPHASVTAKLLQRLRDGAALSSRIKMGHLELLQNQGLIEI